MNRLDQHLSNYLGQIDHGLGSCEGARRDSLELSVTEGISTIPYPWASCFHFQPGQLLPAPCSPPCIKICQISPILGILFHLFLSLIRNPFISNHRPYNGTSPYDYGCNSINPLASKCNFFFLF